MPKEKKHTLFLKKNLTQKKGRYKNKEADDRTIVEAISIEKKVKHIDNN